MSRRVFLILVVLMMSPAGRFSFGDSPRETGDAFGVITEYEGNRLTLREFDYLEDREMTNSYTISSKTRFEFPGDSRPLKAGDDVNVVFRKKGESRTAESVALEEEEPVVPNPQFFDMETLYPLNEEE